MIPIAKPLLGKEEAEAAHEAILSGWVSQGQRVNAFEKAFAQTVNTRYACAVSSCTSALHLALLAVGVEHGDVVVTVSHSFIATANVVRYCGAEPIFVDIDPETYNMDPYELERFLVEECLCKDGKLYYKHVERIAVEESPIRVLYEKAGAKSPSLGRIAAILAVHQMGIPCEIDRIVAIATENWLPVVEDAACAIGSEISFDEGKTWELIGKPHGDIACFSFHPRKVLTTGDGGMITTNDPKFITKFKLMRQHGMSVSDAVRHTSDKVIFEEYVTTAFNYRMTDIQAAVGIEQLKRLDEILIERRRIAKRYEDLIGDILNLRLLNQKDSMLPNWQSYPIRLLEGVSAGQKETMQYLLENGVASRRGVMNAHQEPPYRAVGWSLPKSELCRDRTILLPLFPGMSEEDLEYIANLLRRVLSER